MKRHDVYKGFEVQDVFKIPYYDSEGIFLRHKKSGLEVFHILNNDEENLFAFAFRTPCKDSTGAAHIIEHSVLCGSKNFPIKDPFLKLRNQSINTYLNAYTAKDRTVFPASSLIKEDYFNLMSVYADAVFFPILNAETFLQEGWRIETDKNNQPVIQGVVFNEMKGNYSSFNSVATDAVLNASVIGTGYENDSGGDPLKIPSLSYSQFKEFHKKYYCTANCLVFLYGNIPTEEQLDFIDENVIRNVESYGEKYSFASENSSVKMKRRIDAFGPAQDSKTTTAVVWKIGDSAENENLFSLPMEISFLSELLLGNDSAPVIKLLLNRFKECDIAPQTGCSINSRFFSVAIGVNGLKSDQAKEFQMCIDEAMRLLVEDGIKEEDIERSFMSFDFSIREVKRSPSHGPYSLVLLKRVLRFWTYGANLKKSLSFIESFEQIKQKIKQEPDYLKNLIRKFFVENKNKTLVTVSPSEKWSFDRAEKERKLAARLYKKIGKKNVSLLLEKLRSFQCAQENENLIPSVNIDGLKNPAEKIETRKTLCGKIPFYVNKEACNGIVYASVSFPVDRLDPADYKFLPLLSSCISGLGTKKMSWEETVSVSDRIMGDFGAYIRSANVPAYSKTAAVENPLIIGREWLVLHFKFIEEKSMQAFEFVREIISSIDFSDKERIKTIVNGLCSSLNAAVVPGGHYFAMLRACRLLNRACAVQEIKDGLSSVFAINEIKKMSLSDISEKLESVYKKIIKSGALFHVTAGDSGILAAKKGFSFLAKNLCLEFPKPKKKISDREFFRQTELSGKNSCAQNPCVDELFIVPGNTGFASAVVKSSGENEKKIMADTVLSHLLETSDLWKQVRTAGGAYGVFLSVQSSSGATCFATYRDPRPFESLGYFSEKLPLLEKDEFSFDDIKKAVAGVYSDEIEPYTPAMRGGTGLMRCLYGISLSLDKIRIKNLLSLKRIDIEKSVCRYKNAVFLGNKVAICGKDMVSDKIKKMSGKIIEIAL